MIAAPASNSGKTLVTLALLRLLRERGVKISAVKAGPDYIDPAFHRAALGAGGNISGSVSFNLDCWAMRPELIRALAAEAETSGAALGIEAMMGLFDGAANGRGSAAELAKFLNIPVILVIDCSKFSQSVAALAQGFCGYDKDLRIVGLILNKAGSLKHERLLRDALALKAGYPPLPPILAVLRRDSALIMPERHLGLVQADEQNNLEDLITKAATSLAESLNWELLRDIIGSDGGIAAGNERLPQISLPLPLKGKHIAIAYDKVFRFIYPHIIAAWRQAGKYLSFFSPLNDESPAGSADTIYLPGGYPELYAGKLAQAVNFKAAMRAAAAQGKVIYGECGGYMAMGQSLRDKNGALHEMLNLLPIATDFQNRRLALGYRRLMAQSDFFSSGMQKPIFRGHEFHYACFLEDEQAALAEDKNLRPLFRAADSQGADLGFAGLQKGNVAGSFIHIIDRE